MNKAVFQTRLFRLMKQNQDDDKRRKTKSGLIDSSRLSRFKVTNRIFKHRNQEKKGKNYFVSILMDASGSMRGDKVKMCSDSVVMLCDSLDKIPGMHFEIVGFNSIEVKYKDYYDKYNAQLVRDMYLQQFNGSTRLGVNETTKDAIFRLYEADMSKYKGYSFYSYSSNSGENHDPIAVMNAIKRMKERTGRKILLVFSDGSPTCNFGSSLLSSVKSIEGSTELKKAYDEFGYKYALKKIVDTTPKDIDILAVGILDQSVKSFYQNYIVIENLQELYPKTIKELSKLFKKD